MVNETQQPYSQRQNWRQQRGGFIDNLFSGQSPLVFWIFVITFIVLVISAILRIITPQIEQQPVPQQTNTWQNITPGFSKLSQVQQELGQPIDSENTSFGTAHLYQSSYPTLPNQVIVDSKQTVQFIREYVDFKDAPNLSEYVEKHGDPDLVLFEPLTGQAVRANVFLEEGLVVVAHIVDGTVEQVWYFSPVSEEAFLRSWGNNLKDQVEGPEALIE